MKALYNLSAILLLLSGLMCWGMSYANKHPQSSFTVLLDFPWVAVLPALGSVAILLTLRLKGKSE